MENGEKVIGMLHHVTIGLRYWSCQCTLSWASDDEVFVACCSRSVCKKNEIVHV